MTNPVIDSHGITAPQQGSTHLARMADTTLVGLSTQIDEITDALESVSNGNEQILLLTGEPGIGKSTLIDEATRFARGAELRNGRQLVVRNKKAHRRSGRGPTCSPKSLSRSRNSSNPSPIEIE